MVPWYNTGMDKKTVIPVAPAIIVIMNIAAFMLMLKSTEALDRKTKVMYTVIN